MREGSRGNVGEWLLNGVGCSGSEATYWGPPRIGRKARRDAGRSSRDEMAVTVGLARRRLDGSPVLDGEPDHRTELLQVDVHAVVRTRLASLRRSAFLLESSIASEGEQDGRF